MSWLWSVGGAVLVLIGLVWIGQGLNIIGGSGMSGHPLYAVLGLVVAAAGSWLLWITLRVSLLSGTRRR